MEILVLHRSAETFTRFNDILSLMSFLNRTGRTASYQIVARKERKALFIDKIIGPLELQKDLTEFQNSP